MKKIISCRVLALALAMMLCFSLTAPVFADTTYTPVAGEDVTFQKALVLDANANVPDITFEYSIAPGAAVAASSGKMAIISPSAATGVVGTPTIGTADYNPGDATVTSAEGVTLTADQKAALKTLTVDFSNVTFAEPGIYRYLITETSADQQGITYDTQINNDNDAVSKQRTLDVYVTHSDAVGATEATEWYYAGNTYASLAEAEAARTDANDPTGEISNNSTTGSAGLVVTSYVIHELVNDVVAGANMGSADVATAGAAVADKSLGFVNELETHDLTVSKDVSGNQASQDKYFRFEIAIENAGANANLTVDWSGAEAALNPTQSVATIYTASAMSTANNADDNATIDGKQWVADADGNVTKVVFLKHGQSIVIRGLADGAGYTVTETPEDYLSDQTNNQIVQAKADGASEDGMTADATAAFTNTRDGVIPTGIMLGAAGGIGLALAGIGGIGFAVAKGRKNKEEDDEE